jgi:hypothetical protein
MYKLYRSPRTGEMLNVVLRLEDNACIPFAEDNTDYQAYLAWVAEGNTPLPADEVTQ